MIGRITLRNFKAFRSADIQLAPLTLFTGINATGKSSTLQALALLRQSSEAGLLSKGGGFLLNGELIELGVGQDVLHEDFVSDTGEPPSIEIAVDTTSGSYFWAASYDSSRDREVDILRFSTGSFDAHRFLFGHGFQYLKADRMVPELYYPKSHDTVVRRAFLGARGEHTINFLRIRGDESVPEILRSGDRKTSTLSDSVEGWLQEICPGVSITAEDLRGTDLVRLSYRFFGRAGISSSAISYRPTNVGFGLSYVLPVVVACVSATPGALIMIENPEAHLHPRGQSAMARLAALAAASGAQLLVESHSDHILNGIRLAVKENILPASDVAMHFFRRDRKSKQPIPPVEVQSLGVNADGMLSSWPRGFFDEWDRALDQLLD